MIRIHSFEKPSQGGVRYGVEFTNAGPDELRRVSAVFSLPPGLVAGESLRLTVPRLAPGAASSHEIRVIGDAPGEYAGRVKMSALTASGRLYEEEAELSITVRPPQEGAPAGEAPPEQPRVVLGDLRPAVWNAGFERVELTVRNAGPDPVGRALVMLRGQIEGESRFDLERLAPGSEESAEFNVRARGPGKVRVVAKCFHWGERGGEGAAATRVFWIEAKPAASGRESACAPPVVVHGNFYQDRRVEIRDSVVMGSSVEASGDSPGLCPRCRRPLLPGWAICPFCGQ